MAINLTDFDKIWASTSPLTPYSFSDANYQQGWNFVGATPPARQMWDSYMKLSDEKSQWLYNNKLSLSGGTMTGAICHNSTGSFIRQVSDDQRILICGGSDWYNGADLILYGKDSNSNAGQFSLVAKTESFDVRLVGASSGTLQWNGKEIERVNASGTDYIRYESGLQICWGEMSVPGTAVTDDTITFPQAFKSGSSYQIGVSRSWAYNWNEDYYIKSYTATGFTWSTIGTVSSNSHGYRYIAIGLWK